MFKSLNQRGRGHHSWHSSRSWLWMKPGMLKNHKKIHVLSREIPSQCLSQKSPVAELERKWCMEQIMEITCVWLCKNYDGCIGIDSNFLALLLKTHVSHPDIMIVHFRVNQSNTVTYSWTYLEWAWSIACACNCCFKFICVVRTPI